MAVLALPGLEAKPPDTKGSSAELLMKTRKEKLRIYMGNDSRPHVPASLPE
jgi:hypothetical protein